MLTWVKVCGGKGCSLSVRLSFPAPPVHIQTHGLRLIQPLIPLLRRPPSGSPPITTPTHVLRVPQPTSHLPSPDFKAPSPSCSCALPPLPHPGISPSSRSRLEAATEEAVGSAPS